MKLDAIKKVVVIGAGGTGSILLPQLIRYLRSRNFRGKLIIADGDAYTMSNAERQLFTLHKVGMNKAQYQAMAIVSQLPDMKDQVEYLPKYLSSEDITNLVEDHTVVINCVDNNAARKYVEDRCMNLPNAAHICCGNELTTGQVQICLRSDGRTITNTIFKNSPNFANGGEDRAKMNCEDIAALPGGGQLIAANMMAAAIALNFMIQLTSDRPLHQGGTYMPCEGVAFNCDMNSFQRFDPQPLDFEAIVAASKETTKVAVVGA